MTLKRLSFSLFLMACAVALLLSCNRGGGATATADSAESEESTMAMCDTLAEAEEEEVQCMEQEAAKPTAKVHQPTTPKGKKTIYVSGYGANGEVWGHVTMNGNSGRGTIHDADENTLSITCIRRGNELIATDQNSRQYVFKL